MEILQDWDFESFVMQLWNTLGLLVFPFNQLDVSFEGTLC